MTASGCSPGVKQLDARPCVPCDTALRIARGDAQHAPDPETAAEMLQRAADQGEIRAWYLLGWMYYRGVTGPADPEKAFDCFLRAAHGGIPEAQHMLSVLYGRGEGVPLDRNKSLFWLKKAADQGYGPARNVILKMMKGG